MLHTTPRPAAAILSAVLLAGLAVSSVSAVGSHPGGSGPGYGTDLVRQFADALQGTKNFQDPKAAVKAGYGLPPAPAPLHECISSFDDTGAMGFHYINGDLLDTKVDPRKPEALVYAPDTHGRLHLVALEYVVFQAPWIAKYGTKKMPELFGQMFMSTGEPNRFDIPAFFSLHLWLYKGNPAGLFAPFNPAVSCNPVHQGPGPHRRPDAASTASLAFDCAIDRSRPVTTTRPT